MDYTEWLFKAVYSWPKDMTDGLFVGIFKKAMQERLMDYYNQHANIVNEHIDSWNETAEKDGLCSNLPSYDDPTWYDTEYAKFMKRMYEVVLNVVCINNKPSKRLQFYIGDDLALHMIIKDCPYYNGKDIDLYFVLEPIQQVERP